MEGDLFITDNDGFEITQPTTFVLFEHNGKEIMKFKADGDIYYKGRKLTTDKEIVDGLRGLIQYFRCTKCGGSLRCGE